MSCLQVSLARHLGGIGNGQVNRCRGVGRYCKVDNELPIGDFPVAYDLAANGIVLAASGREIAHDVWFDDEMLKSGCGKVGIDAGQRLVEPGYNVAVHDVVLRSAAAPTFPQGGRPLFDPVAPARLGLLGHDAISHVRATVFQQGVEQILRAEDAGVDMPVLLLDCGNEVAQYPGLVFRLDESLTKCEIQRGLAAVVVNARFGLVEFGVKGLFDARGQIVVCPGVFGFLQQSGGEGDDPCIYVIVSCVGNSRFGFCFPGGPIVQPDVHDAVFCALVR